MSKFEFDSILNKDNMKKIKENQTKIKKDSKKTTNKEDRIIKFQSQTNDSYVKALLISVINSRDVSYDDLLKFSSDLHNGDEIRGRTVANNAIGSLKNSPSMRDTTLSMWCDFLDLDILLAPREKFDVSGEDNDG